MVDFAVILPRFEFPDTAEAPCRASVGVDGALLNGEFSNFKTAWLWVSGGENCYEPWLIKCASKRRCLDNLSGTKVVYLKIYPSVRTSSSRGGSLSDFFDASHGQYILVIFPAVSNAFTYLQNYDGIDRAGWCVHDNDARFCIGYGRPFISIDNLKD
jgi:hypothetical protein